MKTSPDYWIETIVDGIPHFEAVLGSLHDAQQRAIKIVSQFQIDFIVLLSGDYRPGAVALNSQILADGQNFYVPGSYRVK
jgi:hypothetical protein